MFLTLVAGAKSREKAIERTMKSPDYVQKPPQRQLQLPRRPLHSSSSNNNINRHINKNDDCNDEYDDKKIRIQAQPRA